MPQNYNPSERTAAREQASQTFETVADSVEGVATAALDRGRVIGENVQDVASNFKGAVDSSVRNQPLTTLAIAAAMGFLLGAVWKS